MLIRIVPVLAVMITLVALLASPLWPPAQQDGLHAPAHAVTGLF